MNRFSEPKNLNLRKDIVIDSFCYENDALYNHTFETFKSSDNIFYLIYINTRKIIDRCKKKNKRKKSCFKSYFSFIYY